MVRSASLYIHIIGHPKIVVFVMQIIIVAIFANLTAFYRLYYAYKVIKKLEKNNKDDK